MLVVVIVQTVVDYADIESVLESEMEPHLSLVLSSLHSNSKTVQVHYIVSAVYPVEIGAFP